MPRAARVESLEGLQEKTDELQKEFDEKLRKLKEEYGAKKAPFYKQRSEIVAGKDGKGGIPGFWLQAMQNKHAEDMDAQERSVDTAALAAWSHRTSSPVAAPTQPVPRRRGDGGGGRRRDVESHVRHVAAECSRGGRR